ncbi:MAG: hypothetical protein GY723_14675 [bacterium]|nr:hypothetical protein [bacterium]
MSHAVARWSQIVDRSHRTPLTLREFAHREGVNPNTLAWWRWKLRGEESPTTRRFAEVVVVEPDGSDEPHRGDGRLVVQVGVARVEVDASADLQLLRAVVEVLA